MNSARRATAALVLILGAVLAVVALQWRGPKPRPLDAPSHEFSAARAFEQLRATTGGNPHPMGSAENAAVRDRIVARLADLGFDTQVRRLFACNAYGVCGWTDNIVARSPGPGGGPAVMMAAHYDSVAAGPGASDDGSGVATILEIARAVRTERFRNPIIFLIDDGEEAGLLGAEAFLQTPESRFVSAVVNVEARGTSGPSYLFETSARNRWFLPLVARALPHPSTSSIFYTVYQYLPNDTDLTVFKRAGYTGVNFAFIGDVGYYHTRLDDPAHLRLRTLQDQGDNSLAALRTLANADLHQRSSDDAVWFDVLGLFVAWWPARWTFFLALLGLGTSLVAAAVLVRDDESTVNELAAGVLVVIGSVIAGAVGGYALSILSSARARGPWLALPGAAVAASWVIGIVAALAVGSAMRRRARPAALFAGIAIAWNFAALGMSVPVAGMTHLLIVPGIAMAVASLVRATATDDEVVAELACAGVAAVIWFPLLTAIYAALGQPSLTLIGGATALLATTFVSLYVLRLRTTLAGVAAAILLAIVSAALPPVTGVRPQHISISYLDDGSSGRWACGNPSASMRAVAPFERAEQALFPWARGSSPLLAPAPRLNLAPVTIAKMLDSGEGKRTVSLHVASPRRAARVSLFFQTRATVEQVRINGFVPPFSERAARRLANGWRVAAIRGSDAMDVEITTRGHQPIEVIATDTTFGLPKEGRALAVARNASRAVPTGDGDTVTTMRRAKF